MKESHPLRTELPLADQPDQTTHSQEGDAGLLAQPSALPRSTLEPEEHSQAIRKPQNGNGIQLRVSDEQDDDDRLCSFCIDRAGRIVQSNSAGASFLGIERGSLAGQQFIAFIDHSDHPVFTDFLSRVFENPSKEVCEVAIQSLGTPSRFVRVEATAQADRSACRLSILDYIDRRRQDHIERRRQTITDKAYLTALVESANDAIIGKTLDGVVTDWNRAAERIFGYPAAEAVGRTFSSLAVPPSLQAEEDDILARVARGESIVNFTTTRCRRDGSLFDASITVSPIKTSDGQIVGVVKTVCDITAQRWAEERFRLVVEAAPNAILMVDTNRKITLVNRGAEEMFGYARSQLLGMEIEYLMPPRFRAKHPYFVQHYAQDPAPRAMGARRDLFGLRRDGTEIPIEIGITPIKTAEGLSVLASIIDITERKRAEARIMELNATLEQQVAERTAQLHTYSALQRAILANAGYPIIATDTDGMITLFNPAAEAMLGYTAEEMIGNTTPAIFHDPEELAAGSAALSHELGRVIEPGFAVFMAKSRLDRPDPSEWTYIRKDGTRLPVLLNVNILHDDNGQILGYIGIAADLTERKRIESLIAEQEAQQRRNAERLARINAELETARAHAERMAQAKSEFLANMSHEIRTPMNAIIGLAYLLENGMVRGEALGLVKKIRVAGRSLLALINDILDFSKIEAGRLELEQAPFRLRDVLDNLATVMSTAIGEKDIEFVVSPPPPGVHTLLGDVLRLEQVLINLVGNAFKFTESGEVVVEVRCVWRTQKTVALRLSVRDTGMGISEDKQAEIFSAFSQADTSTTRRFGGTGLGLAISRKLVNLMGGELKVYSKLGEGSEFYFTVPFDLGTDSDASVPSIVGLRVLIADDNRIAREMLKLTVQSLHWEADVVESGEAALERINTQYAQDQHYDVFLIDWKMPGLDGLGTVEAIRKHALREAHSPSIIMVTAYARENLLQKPQAQFLDGIITKPATPSVLYDAVVLAQSRGRDGTGVHPSRQSDGSMPKRLPGLTVLVVDDSDINREVAQRILAREGAAVFTANDGQSAVEWIRRRAGEIDIVLMDVQMPLMDGHEATRQIRQMPQGRNLPIVALSAGAFKEQQDAALEVGMDAYIAKPLNVDQMVAIIQAQVGVTSSAESRNSAKDGVMSPDGLPELEHLERLPGLDTARGLRLVGDPQVYRRYLLMFSETYRQTGEEIDALVREYRRDEATAIAHTLAGAAGNLALTEVWQIACLVEQSSEATDTVMVGLTWLLRQALGVALASIERYCGAMTTVTDQTPDPGSANSVQIGMLLRDLLKTLDEDNPDSAEPVINALAEFLPEPLLRPVRKQVDSFDFRSAELETKILAEKLGIGIAIET